MPLTSLWPLPIPCGIMQLVIRIMIMIMVLMARQLQDTGTAAARLTARCSGMWAVQLRMHEIAALVAVFLLVEHQHQQQGQGQGEEQGGRISTRLVICPWRRSQQLQLLQPQLTVQRWLLLRRRVTCMQTGKEAAAVC